MSSIKINQKIPLNQASDFDLEALRPVSWDDYVGQDRVKSSLRLILQAAKKRGECSDHILFYGQAGLGKTTLAYLAGKEMGVGVRSTTGPNLLKVGDVAAILSNLEANEILFIDEIHRMSSSAEEALYPALESRKLHLVVGKGPSARTVSIDLPPFTVVAATTKAHMLSSPLRSRFGAVLRLDYYSVLEIGRIISRSASILGVDIRPEAISRISRAARFTPRVANRLLRRARDYAEIYGKGVIEEKTALDVLDLLEVDEVGLERIDRELLTAIVKKFGGGPVGLAALGAVLNEEIDVIESVYEPYLMSLGFLNRTRMGRVVTDKGRSHIEGAG